MHNRCHCGAIVAFSDAPDGSGVRTQMPATNYNYHCGLWVGLNNVIVAGKKHGFFYANEAFHPEPLTPPKPVLEIAPTLSEYLDQAECYRRLKARNLDYGPAFQSLRDVWRSQAIAERHSSSASSCPLAVARCAATASATKTSFVPSV